MLSNKTLVFGGATALALYAAYNMFVSDVRQAASEAAEHYAEEPEIDSDLARDAFATTTLAPPTPVEGHTHAKAAAIRTSATSFARSYSMSMGAGLYSVQMSKYDQRKGIRGTRKWFWSKDTNVPTQHDSPLEDDVEYMCDVDYYVDMPEYLTERAKPVLLYTVVPEEAAGTASDDTSFYFNESGELETIVSGGGRFCHHLWDYSGDSVIVEKKFWGFTYKMITYAVERRQVAYSRQLVLLSPIKVFRGIFAFIASKILGGKRLERFDPIVTGKNGEKFVRIRVHTVDNTLYSTARPSSHLCATVDAEVDEAIATVARLGTANLVLPTTASWVDGDRKKAAVLTEFYRSVCTKKAPTVYPVSEAVRAYSFEPHLYNQEDRPKMDAFMSPLVHEAFVPIPNAAGERRCVKGRINDLKKEEPKFSPFVQQCINDFVTEVVRGVILEPVDVQEVVEKQTRPQQKLSLAKAFLAGPAVSRVLKCFVKAEAYGGLKDPRNISTYNDKDKLTMAQFALALSRHLKQYPWYGPGKTPIEVAQRVADICSNAEMVNVSDYHRMDGTISYLLRTVDRAVFMKAFKHHRPLLNELLKRNCDNTGILPNGTRFEQGSSHGSGCSATSTSQTLRAAFTAYLGFRNSTRPCGQRYTSEQAFGALGIHLGDDGLDADLAVENHTWAAKKVGLVLEAGTVSRGFRGVTFLARYYSPDVWTGRLDSMCDVKRQLSKFHVTLRLPAGVTAEAKLVEKAMGYAATDGNTPVVGEFCQKALALSDDGLRRSDLGIGSWWSSFDATVQFPNDNSDGWMDAEFTTQFPEFDRRMFTDWLCSVGTVGQLVRAPLCAEPTAPKPASVPVVVDNDVIPPMERDGVSPCESTELPKDQPLVENEQCKDPKQKPRAKPTQIPRRRETSTKSSTTRPPADKSADRKRGRSTSRGSKTPRPLETRGHPGPKPQKTET